jgi:hypothetical protein
VVRRPGIPPRNGGWYFVATGIAYVGRIDVIHDYSCSGLVCDTGCGNRVKKGQRAYINESLKLTAVVAYPIGPHIGRTGSDKLEECSRYGELTFRDDDVIGINLLYIYAIGAIRCVYITPGEIAPTGNENCVYVCIYIYVLCT